MFLGRAKNNDGDDRIFLEGNPAAVVRSLESGDPTEYFFIGLTPGAIALRPVTLKPGPRADGTALEIAEIVANAIVVGSAEVPK